MVVPLYKQMRVLQLYLYNNKKQINKQVSNKKNMKESSKVYLICLQSYMHLQLVAIAFACKMNNNNNI